MDEKKYSILNALHLKVFPRGIHRFCRENWEEHFDWWVEQLREEIAAICKAKCDDDDKPSEPGDGHYYCEWVPRPDKGPGCRQKVCYDEFGNVVHTGRVKCPPGT